MGGGVSKISKTAAEANSQDLEKAVNFATISFQGRQNLFRESLKNEDYPGLSSLYTVAKMPAILLSVTCQI